MIARSNFLKANLVKADGLTDDESEKEFKEKELPKEKEKEKEEEENNQLQQISGSKSVEQNGKQPSKDKSKGSEDPKGSKASKEKVQKEKSKEKSDSLTKSTQDLTSHIEQPINNEAEEILLNRPPTPPKPKVFLPPIDATPFIRSKIPEPIFKDDKFIKEQDIHRKTEVNNFLHFKEQMIKFRDEEKKYRLYQKVKQIEECEALQVNILKN